MHSRAILFLSLFALVCLALAGSIALHLTSASASANDAASDLALQSPSGSPNLEFFRDTSEPGSVDAGVSVAELSAAEQSSADSLQTLLRQVHIMFEPESASVSNVMIPYIAEMITVINQHDHLVYRIELLEPDAALARRRAQTLNDVLRLNVLDPSKLRIVGRQGLHAALVDVSAL